MDDRLLSFTISIPKPFRRSFRLSLCTVLLLTVIAGIWLGLGGQHWATMQRKGSVREPAASRSVATGIPLSFVSLQLHLPCRLRLSKQVTEPAWAWIPRLRWWSTMSPCLVLIPTLAANVGWCRFCLNRKKRSES